MLWLPGQNMMRRETRLGFEFQLTRIFSPSRKILSATKSYLDFCDEHVQQCTKEWERPLVNKLTAFLLYSSSSRVAVTWLVNISPGNNTLNNLVRYLVKNISLLGKYSLGIYSLNQQSEERLFFEKTLVDLKSGNNTPQIRWHDLLKHLRNCLLVVLFDHCTPSCCPMFMIINSNVTLTRTETRNLEIGGVNKSFTGGHTWLAWPMCLPWSDIVIDIIIISVILNHHCKLTYLSRRVFSALQCETGFLLLGKVLYYISLLSGLWWSTTNYLLLGHVSRSSSRGESRSRLTGTSGQRCSPVGDDNQNGDDYCWWW